MIRTALLPLILVLLSLNGLSQEAEPDTTGPRRDSTLTYYFYNDFDRFGRLNVKATDTVIENASSYNPLFRQSRLRTSLGNIGSTSAPMVPGNFVSNPGFDYGIHTFDPWLFQNDSVRYYKVLKTYTDLRYEQGANKELFFDAVFSRNIYKSFNLGFNFRVLSSTGAYQRQKDNIVNFVLTGQYFTPDRRYAVIANLTLNRIKNQENGGITSDSLFTENIESNRFVIPVNLQQAQNRVKETGIYIKNYFTLASGNRSSQDTTRPPRKSFNLGRIIFAFQYDRQVQNYLDAYPFGGYYENVYYDSTATADSITVTKLAGELAWTNPVLNARKKFKTLQMDFRMKYQYLEVADREGKDYLSQWIPSAAISFQPYYGLRLEGKASYVMGDYNSGDFSIQADLGIIPGKRDGKAGTIHFTGTYALQQPSWFLHRYNSNHFRWDIPLEKQGILAASAWYEREYLNAGASMSRISHYAYLNDTAYPAQLSKGAGYLAAWVKGQLPFWRFALSGELVYQHITGTDAIRVPEFSGYLRLVYTQPLFHGAAVIQPGLSFFYNTSYFACAYMPDNRSFYLQNVQKTGNYLYMDVFLNVKIQRARLFAMYSHFNSGWMGYHYMTVPGYPMPDGAFHFGVTWRFHD